jgi:hypothetical protein
MDILIHMSRRSSILDGRDWSRNTTHGVDIAGIVIYL